MNKKRGFIHYFLVALCCLFLYGCPQVFDMDVDGIEGNRPIFEMEKGVLLSHIQVISAMTPWNEKNGFDVPEIFWRTEIPDYHFYMEVKGKSLRKLIYGQKLAGFKELVPPKKLIPGQYYYVRARSSNKGYGFATFRFLKDGENFDIDVPGGLWESIFGRSRPGHLFPKELKQAARDGDAEAQYQMGLRCEFGDGYWQDTEEAYEWFLKAARQGHAKAQYWTGRLGVFDFAGIGRQAIFNWHLKSAGQGYHRAQVKVGSAYYYGSGTPQDYGEAIKWFLAAANQGNVRAMLNLADCYRDGKGVPRNMEEYTRWKQKARGILKKAGAILEDYYL